MWRVATVLAVLPLAAAACGGHDATTPGFNECADAWNASANAHDRAVVAGLVGHGYTRAGIQMSVTSGTPLQKTDPNPVGCRVVVFNARRYAAYLARRDDGTFVFHPGTPQHIADQSGRWPPTSTPGPSNAEVSPSGTVTLVGTGKPVVAAKEWKAVLDDYVDDGRVNRRHTCAAVRAAIAHLPTFSYVDRTLGGAEQRYCGG